MLLPCAGYYRNLPKDLSKFNTNVVSSRWTILVPTDGSEIAERAVKYGAKAMASWTAVFPSQVLPFKAQIRPVVFGLNSHFGVSL